MDQGTRVSTGGHDQMQAVTNRRGKNAVRNLNTVRNINPIFTVTKSTPSSNKPSKPTAAKSPNVKDIIPIFKNTLKHSVSKPANHTEPTKN